MILAQTGSCMRIGIALGLWSALAAGPAAALERSPGCTGDTRPDRLSGITAEGDLVLGSERLARLSGLRLPDDPIYKPQALDWLRSRTGQALVISIQGSRDRWDRLPIRARMSGGPQILDVSHSLVEAGLAIVDPGTDSVFCQPELLALE